MQERKKFTNAYFNTYRIYTCFSINGCVDYNISEVTYGLNSKRALSKFNSGKQIMNTISHKNKVNIIVSRVLYAKANYRKIFWKNRLLFLFFFFTSEYRIMKLKILKLLSVTSSLLWILQILISIVLFSF